MKAAEKWINENQKELTEAGFKDEDLFNKNLPKGIAGLLAWFRPGVTAEVRGGKIIFSWRAANGIKVIQTATPEWRSTL